jgi:CRP/FNR family transcriptional regulator, anaerobic regulatory protein
MPVGLSDAEIEKVDTLIGARRKIPRGTPLYLSGETFQSLFAIRTGFFKTEVISEDGREQVTGFQMAGELMGLDGIGSGQHNCDARALEDSEVCVIPFNRLSELSREIDTLQHHFHKVMSREIVRDQAVMMLLGTMRAEERLAAFLVNLSQRFVSRGYSATEFNLRMTREEIGSYLGLKLETVSRGLSRLQDEGLLSVQNKKIRIHQLDALKRAMSPRC